jgi:two-component system, NtrC family, sensor histidine kinase HydH
MTKGKRYKTLYLPALIIVATVLTLLIVIAVSTYRNLNRERERTEENLLRGGLVVIRVIEAGLRAEASTVPPDLSRLQRLLAELSHEPSISRILLFDMTGKTVTSSAYEAEQTAPKDISALQVLFRDKGVITRYQESVSGERTFEILKPLRPFSYKDPLAAVREGEAKIEAREEPLQRWAKDKILSVNLRLGAFERARMEDLHHALLMGGILVVLGTGALYFIFIVQNYYVVDRSLAEMKTYTENVVESMADGLISVNREGKIVTLNRKAAEFFGAKDDDLKNKEISRILGPDIEILLKAQKEIIRDRDLWVSHPSGVKIPLSLSITPLKDEAGREMGSVLLLRDLREIRDLQEKVRRSERLASLGRLAAGVAHEIRNPLSSIRGFAQFFQNRFKGQEKEQEYASVMVREVDRLNRVITELLDFARPKEPHRELHSAGEILEQTLKLLESELAKKNIAVEKNLGASLPRILVDRDQLSQAFLNLLLNALESMEGAGKIRISMESGGAEVLAISISDTGRGIPKEDLERVFEPFFSTKRKGTGLGLAIVHQIVESHKGEIQVESREGQGATFRITLPIR